MADKLLVLRKSCCCGWGSKCKKLRRASQYPQKMVRVSRVRAIAEPTLHAVALQLGDPAALVDVVCGKKHERTGKWLVRPKETYLWIGHYFDCDMVWGEDGATPLRVKNATEHPDLRWAPVVDAVPGRGGASDALPLPQRPMEGCDGHLGTDAMAVERAQRAVARMAASPATVPVTPAAIRRNNARPPKRKALPTEVKPDGLEDAGAGRVDARVLPLARFATNFDATMQLVRQVEAHARHCDGNLSARADEMSVHGLAGRIVLRCRKQGDCTCAYVSGSKRIAWLSSPINPDGKWCVDGKEFVDHEVNDSAVKAEALSTCLMNMGFKVRAPRVQLAYEKQIVAPRLQALREEEQRRVLDDKPGRIDGVGGEIIGCSDTGHSGVVDD
eukprot:SAG11_NODE_282_length_11247_cov_11.050323_10_plen_386_part_00